MQTTKNLAIISIGETKFLKRLSNFQLPSWSVDEPSGPWWLSGGVEGPKGTFFAEKVQPSVPVYMEYPLYRVHMAGKSVPLSHIVCSTMVSLLTYSVLFHKNAVLEKTFNLPQPFSA